MSDSENLYRVSIEGEHNLKCWVVAKKPTEVMYLLGKWAEGGPLSITISYVEGGTDDENLLKNGEGETSAIIFSRYNDYRCVILRSLENPHHGHLLSREPLEPIPVFKAEPYQQHTKRG